MPRVAMVAYTDYASDPRVRREAEALSGRGDRVVVYSLATDSMRKTATLNGVEIRPIAIKRYRGGKAMAYVRSYGRFFTAAFARLSASHLRDRFDVVHVHTMPDFMVFTAGLPKLGRAKVVLDMHDLMPDLYAVKFGLDRSGKAVSFLRTVERVSARFADAVICVHEPQRRLLLRDGIPEQKISVVMNAPDPKIFFPREAEPSDQERIGLVYHGTILHRYGVDIAVRAFAKARREEPRLFFTILGDGDFVQDVRALSSELGLGPDAIFISGERFTLDEVSKQIRDFHIGIVANRDDQEDSVLPTKLLEYMAVGIPSVAAHTRCIAHHFDDSVVELVPPEDVDGFAEAILRLARDKELRKARVSAGHQWDRDNGFTRQKEVLFELYDRLLAPASPH